MVLRYVPKSSLCWNQRLLDADGLAFLVFLGLTANRNRNLACI
jgi:hypothetical protein